MSVRKRFSTALVGVCLWMATAGAQETVQDMSDLSLDNIDRLWDFTDPQKSEGRFRALLREAEGAEHVHARIETLTQIARAEGLQRKFEDAHETLDEAEALLTGETRIGRIRVALERGRLHNSSGDAKGSRQFFERALSAAREAGEEYYAVDAAHMLGIVTETNEQIDWNLRAMEMAEAAEDPRARKWLGALYNNIGWAYHDIEDYEKAEELLAKALAWYQDNGTDRQVRIGKWSVAKILRLQGRVDEALERQKALVDEWEAVGESDGYVFEELGECYLELGEQKKAQLDFARAHEELLKDAWLVANEPDRLARLKELGRVED